MGAHGDRLANKLLASLNEHDGVLLPAVAALLAEQDNAYPITAARFDEMSKSRDLIYESRQQERHRAAKAEAERDAALAVIEQAKKALDPREDHTLGLRIINTRNVLDGRTTPNPETDGTNG
jgi:hypothetical protein